MSGSGAGVNDDLRDAARCENEMLFARSASDSKLSCTVLPADTAGPCKRLGPCRGSCRRAR